MKGIIFDFYKSYSLKDGNIVDNESNEVFRDNNIEVLGLPEKISSILCKRGLIKITNLIILSNEILECYGFNEASISYLYGSLLIYLSSYNSEALIEATKPSIEPEVVEKEPEVLEAIDVDKLELKPEIDPEPIEKIKVDSADSTLLVNQIDYLRLSEAAREVLRDNKIINVSSLLELNSNDIASLSNMTTTILRELKAFRVSLFDEAYFKEAKEEKLDEVKPFDASLRLEELGFSVRTYNALKNANINTFKDLSKLDSVKLRNIKGLGAKAYKEIVDKVNELSELQTASANKLNNPDGSILTILHEVNFRGMELAIIYKKLRDIDKNQIDEALNKLIGMDKIYKNNNRYYFKYKPFSYYVDNIKDARTKDIILKRLDGKTLDICGSLYGISRERARQISDKFLLKTLGEEAKPIIYTSEDKYRYLFTNYFISEEEFIYAFKEPLSTYRYLYIRYDRGKKAFSDALNDDFVSDEFKNKIELCSLRNYIKLDGENVLMDKHALLEHYLKNNAINKLMLNEIYTGYNNMLNRAKLDDSYRFEEKNFDRILERTTIAIKSIHRGYRYYDLATPDFSELLEVINLKSYMNMELSTRLFINKYPRLMKDYDIRDEYELHYLLKYLYKDSNPNISFDRTPFITIGKSDINNYLTNLFIQNGNLSYQELLDELDKGMGINAEQAISVYIKPIAKFKLKHNTYGLLDDKYKFDSIDKSILIKMMRKDYYTLAELKDVFIKAINDVNGDKINSHNLKSIGYSLYEGYAVKSTIDAKDIFKNLLSDEIFSLDNELLKQRYFLDVFYEERANLNILEFDDRKFINIKRLNKIGVTKAMLIEFSNEVKSFIGSDEIFTIKSLREHGFKSKLDRYKLNDRILDSVLIGLNSFNSTKTLNAAIFSSSTKPTIIKLIEEITRENGSIYLIDLMECMKNTYGISITKDRLMQGMKSTGMYYSQAREKLYIDIDEYYKDK